MVEGKPAGTKGQGNTGEGAVDLSVAGIEERAFKIPGVKDVTVGPVFAKFFNTVLPRLTLPATGGKILEGFVNNDITSESFAQLLRENPYYEQFFMQKVKSLAGEREIQSLSSAIVLMGMVHSRNFVVALQMHRTARQGPPEMDGDGKLTLQVSDMLSYAQKTEEGFASVSKDPSDVAFASGMMFDYVIEVGRQILKDPKPFEGFVETLFIHSLRTAKVSMGLVEHTPDFGFKKLLFGAALIHDIGKAVMALCVPKYIEFLGSMSEGEITREMRHFSEEKTFGITHDVLGAFFCRSFGAFKAVESAIYHHHDPYQLYSINKSMFQLAALLSSSSNVASNFKKVEMADDPIVHLWQGPDVMGYGPPKLSLIEIVGQIVAKSGT